MTNVTNAMNAMLPAIDFAAFVLGGRVADAGVEVAVVLFWTPHFFVTWQNPKQTKGCKSEREWSACEIKGKDCT